MKGWIGLLICAIVTALIGWKVFGLLGLGVGLFFLPYYSLVALELSKKTNLMS